MDYVRKFDPQAVADRSTAPGGVPYEYNDDLILAVNVALAAGRPLLLRGDPGCGKTTLAADVAWRMRWRYEPVAITSRTSAESLKWRSDPVRRLADATDQRSAGEARDPGRYIDPGILWRAFHPDLAREYRASIKQEAPRNAVILMDEIDKADPDVPNDLLMVLDQGWFEVPELNNLLVARQDEVETLIVITTNGERDLAPAFVRRCIAYDMPKMTETQLRLIAGAHFPDFDPKLLDTVLKLLADLATRATMERVRAPSAAEMIDALRACRELKIVKPDSTDLDKVGRAAMWKHRPADPGR